jgi:hypothetical protein
MKTDYRATTPTGKCTKCGINCWKDSNNQPAIWPCGLEECPYPQSAKVVQFHTSSTGSSLLGVN